jgi:hypothetical protein
VLAFGAVVYGGIKYIFAAGNPSGQSEGRDWITGAIWGLLLLAGAYLLLNVINPNLTNLSLPTLTSVGGVGVGGTTGGGFTGGGGTYGGGGANGGWATSTCALAPLTPITDPAASAMENGATVVWTSSDAHVQANLTKLQQEFGKLQNIMSKQGGSATANSVYRPLAYQKHLYEIYQESQTYNGNQALYDGNLDCAYVISTLKAEEQKHGICYDGKPCLVASPDNCAPHVEGIGIDISLSPATSLNSINTVLQNNNIDLRWQALQSDPVHFNLQNPPYSGCGS